MRIALIATSAAALLLGACGSPKESQANDAQANISNDSRAETNATGSAVVVPIGQAATADEVQHAMHERHEAMEQIGKATKAASRELKAGQPDLATVRASAKTINDLAGRLGPWFPKGSGPEAGKTGAKPEIWAHPEDFSSKLSDFQKAAAAFNQAAAGNDVAAIKKSFADLGGTCKACHDKYRSEMKH